MSEASGSHLVDVIDAIVAALDAGVPELKDKVQWGVTDVANPPVDWEAMVNLLSDSNEPTGEAQGVDPWGGAAAAPIANSIERGVSIELAKRGRDQRGGFLLAGKVQEVIETSPEIAALCPDGIHYETCQVAQGIAQNKAIVVVAVIFYFGYKLARGDVSRAAGI